MMKPRLFNGTEWIDFQSAAEHDAYVASITQPSKPDFTAIVEERIAIGRKIMTAYLADNAAINLTFAQSVEQLQKFQTVKAFLEVGNLEDSKILIANVATDDVFTQERKDKYLAMFP